MPVWETGINVTESINNKPAANTSPVPEALTPVNEALIAR